MTEPLAAGTLFVGIGHPVRRDDGVGPWLAEALAADGFRAVALTGDGAALIDMIAAETRVVVADATESGRPPGTRITLDAAQRPLPAGCFRASTHQFGLAEAVETARALGQLPPHLIVLGIEGTDFTMGEGLSPPVARAAEALRAALSGRPAAPHRA